MILLGPRQQWLCPDKTRSSLYRSIRMSILLRFWSLSISRLLVQQRSSLVRHSIASRLGNRSIGLLVYRIERNFDLFIDFYLSLFNQKFRRLCGELSPQNCHLFQDFQKMLLGVLFLDWGKYFIDLCFPNQLQTLYKFFLYRSIIKIFF